MLGYECVLTDLCRYSDFLYGLPTTNLASVADTSDSAILAPADRLRLLHDYITSTTEDAGLGIVVGLPQWDRVESVMALQDHDFNHEWIKTWSTHRVGDPELDKIRDQVSLDLRSHSAYAYMARSSARASRSTSHSSRGIAASSSSRPCSASRRSGSARRTRRCTRPRSSSGRSRSSSGGGSASVCSPSAGARAARSASSATVHSSTAPCARSGAISARLRACP
jgi:hypothetical protein